MKKVIIDLGLLKHILEEESKKLTGQSMKRFEISNNLNEVKNNIKELQYEWCRNLFDIIEYMTINETSIKIDYTKK